MSHVRPKLKTKVVKVRHTGIRSMKGSDTEVQEWVKYPYYYREKSAQLKLK